MHQRKIELTQGQVALVDSENYAELSKHKWYARYNKTTKSYYAVRNISLNNGKRGQLYMHRVVTNCPCNKQVDHIDHQTLDNQKKNLRICTQKQNKMNRVKHKKAVSKYKGVHLASKKHKDKIYSYWDARVQINGKRVWVGYFKSEIEAAKAYNKKAKELFGEFALLNGV